jgi:hypothetical protein
MKTQDQLIAAFLLQKISEARVNVDAQSLQNGLAAVQWLDAIAAGKRQVTNTPQTGTEGG